MDDEPQKLDADEIRALIECWRSGQIEPREWVRLCAEHPELAEAARI